jgi:hypothetical protein
MSCTLYIHDIVGGTQQRGGEGERAREEREREKEKERESKLTPVFMKTYTRPLSILRASNSVFIGAPITKSSYLHMYITQNTNTHIYTYT